MRMNDHISLSKQADFYDERWAGDDKLDRLNRFQLARVAAVFDALSYLDMQFKFREREDFRICDFGCGRGWLTAQLSAMGRVTGVDLSPEGVKLASKRWPHIEFVCADVLTFEANRTFDLLVTSEVIEHIPDSKKDRFVESLVKNIKPEGFLVLTTPNGLVKWAWEKDGQLSQPVEDWPTPSELRRLVRRDFKILSHKAFLYEFSYRGIHRYLSAPKLVGFLRRTGVLPAYEGILSSLGIGLHQVLVAQRK